MANFVKDEGIYRCRLQIDDNTGFACIDADEHYAWDKERKCLDESKPLGGQQILLRADAWKVNEDGTLDNERLELNMDNFGVTIVTKKEFGEKPRPEVICNFMRIFGLSDVKELFHISKVSQEQLLGATFDVRVHLNNKGYTNYWFAPVGEAEPKRAFVTPTKNPKNRAQIEKYIQMARVECKGLIGVAPRATMPVTAPEMPPKAMPAKAPAPAKADLPPRESAQEGITLNDVWDRWVSAYPDDASTGAGFYEAIAQMFGSKDAQDLTPAELSAFVKAKLANAPANSDANDLENIPF